MKTATIFFISLFLALILSLQLSSQTAPYPISNFSVTPGFICAGGTVQFSDLSSNNPTSWNWTFQGGSPATSTLQNPVVVYNNPGKYDVILSSSNEQGTHAKGTLNAVTVAICSNIRENFEDFNLYIFPNPTQSYVNLTAPIDAKFTLYNVIGSALLSGYVKKDEITKVDLGNFPAGVYFFTLKNGTRSKSFKIAKD